MDAANSSDVEAPKDPGALKSHPSLTDNEIHGERLCYAKRGASPFLAVMARKLDAFITHARGN